MTARSIRLYRQSFPESRGLDTAISHALLLRAAQGLEPEAFRLFRPGRVLAFGAQDLSSPGFPAAVAAAEAHGFKTLERLGGGRAAVFHEETLAFAWTIPDPEPRAGIKARFEAIAELMAKAFRRLGVDGRVGEVPGEYCPGPYSVNARGEKKLMGVGQRLVRDAAHVGGVVVVGGSGRIREVLVPVYTALGLAWRPEATGSIRDEVPGVSFEDVEGAILDELRKTATLVEQTFDPALLALAAELEAGHLLPAAARA